MAKTAKDLVKNERAQKIAVNAIVRRKVRFWLLYFIISLWDTKAEEKELRPIPLLIFDRRELLTNKIATRL